MTGESGRLRVRLIPTVFANAVRDRTALEDLKREISPEIYEYEDHFRQFLTETFLRLSRRGSFADDRIETFLPNIQRLR